MTLANFARRTRKSRKQRRGKVRPHKRRLSSGKVVRVGGEEIEESRLASDSRKILKKYGSDMFRLSQGAARERIDSAKGAKHILVWKGGRLPKDFNRPEKAVY